MIQPSRGLVVAAWLCLAFAAMASRVPLNQTDVWLHLAFGTQWLDRGRLDPADITPIALPGAPGLNSYWLSQAAIAWAWTKGGVAGIQALHAAAIAIRLLAVAMLLKACGCADRRLVLVMVVTVGLAIGHAPVFRPQVLAELWAAPLLVLVLWPGHAWWPWLASGAVLGAWALFHGSFLVGVALVLAAATGRALAGSHRARRLMPLGGGLLALAIAGALAVGLHPSGWNALADTLAMGANRAVRFQDEWQPLMANRSAVSKLLWVASLFWWAWAMAMAARRGHFPWACVAVGLPLALAPLWHQRFLVWWYLAAPILVARAFPPGEPREEEAELAAWQGWVGIGTGLAAAIALCGPAMAWTNALPDESLMAPATPHAVAKALRGAVQPMHSNQPGGRIFVSESLGDYLAWSLGPRAPALLHSHVHLLPPEHYDACLAIKWARPGWDRQLAAWGADLVLVEAMFHPRLRDGLASHPDWIILRDDTTVANLDPRAKMLLAIRREGSFAKVHNLMAVDPAGTAPQGSPDP
jgi:hypothetical protein